MCRLKVKVSEVKIAKFKKKKKLTLPITLKNNDLDLHIGYAYRPSNDEHEYAKFMKVRSKVKVTEDKMSDFMICFNS